ncbi:MAG: hypothetical protein GEU71_13100 [Actinobacteria bacterium]|nr:hypothetical protein [Actinomycetota bacterium]
MRVKSLGAAGVALIVTISSCGPQPAQPNAVESPSQESADTNAESVCPIAVRYALAEPREQTKARLVVEDNPQVVSALRGVVTDVAGDEESGWARVMVRSSDMSLTYRFYLDSVRGGLPAEGETVAAGDPIGGAHELLDVEAMPIDAGNPRPVSGLLDEWGCHEGLPKVDVLRARLLDGSIWEIGLAKPIEVIGAEGAGAYGELEVDGEIVAGATRFGQRPDFSRPDFPGFDPPELLEEFKLADGRRAEHWDLAPSHENDTFAYALWVEGPGEHMYFSSGQPIEDAGLVAQSLRMTQSGREIESVWFESDRVEIVNQQAVFFLMDPSAPLRGPEVRINTTCRIGHEQGSACEKAELEVPVYTPGTKAALERATLTRVGP